MDLKSLNKVLNKEKCIIITFKNPSFFRDPKIKLKKEYSKSINVIIAYVY